MMADSDIERTGSCLCGAIQVRIQGKPLWSNLCYCTSCQKASGVYCASNAAYKEDQVTYTFSSPEVLKVYCDGSPISGNVVERAWCGNCGSPVRNKRPAPGNGMLAVPMGIIDGDKGGELKPGLELFCANREEWVGEVEGAKSYVGMPPPMPTVT